MSIPLSEYPRPQMVRDSYMCLNGTWDLRFLSDGDDAKTVPIMVPYSPESDFSGVGRTLQAHETMLYSRHVEFPGVDFSMEKLHKEDIQFVLSMFSALILIMIFITFFDIDHIFFKI